jgi:hypothetical protein
MEATQGLSIQRRSVAVPVPAVAASRGLDSVQHALGAIHGRPELLWKLGREPIQIGPTAILSHHSRLRLSHTSF